MNTYDTQTHIHRTNIHIHTHASSSYSPCTNTNENTLHTHIFTAQIMHIHSHPIHRAHTQMSTHYAQTHIQRTGNAHTYTCILIPSIVLICKWKHITHEHITHKHITHKHMFIAHTCTRVLLLFTAQTQTKTHTQTHIHGTNITHTQTHIHCTNIHIHTHASSSYAPCTNTNKSTPETSHGTSAQFWSEKTHTRTHSRVHTYMHIYSHRTHPIHTHKKKKNTPQGPVTSARFWGEKILSTSDDGTLRMWNPENLECVFVVAATARYPLYVFFGFFPLLFLLLTSIRVCAAYICVLHTHLECVIVVAATARYLSSVCFFGFWWVGFSMFFFGFTSQHGGVSRVY